MTKKTWLVASLVISVAWLAWAQNSTFTILHTNDTHSQLENMARQATLIEEIRLQVPNLLLLHAGDTVMGTLYYTVHKGAADAWVLEQMGFTAMTLGNHEFNEGPAGLAQFADAVAFPLLCANFDFSGEPLLVGKVVPYVVVAVEGGQVGIIGLTTESAAWSSNPGPNIVIGDPITAARRAVDELTALGVNAVIALTHLGWEQDLELARSVTGIDIVIGGHSHTLPEGYPTVVERVLVNINTASLDELQTLRGIGPALAQRVIDYREAHGPFQAIEEITKVTGIGPATLAGFRDRISVADVTLPALVVRAGEKALHLGRLEVTFDEHGVLQAWGGELIPVDKLPMEPMIEAQLAVFRAPIDALKAQVVGETKVDLDGDRGRVRTRETNLGNLVADSMLWKAEAAGAQIAVQNGAGYTPPFRRVPPRWDRRSRSSHSGITLLSLRSPESRSWRPLRTGCRRSRTSPDGSPTWPGSGLRGTRASLLGRESCRPRSSRRTGSRQSARRPRTGSSRTTSSPGVGMGTTCSVKPRKRPSSRS